MLASKLIVSLGFLVWIGPPIDVSDRAAVLTEAERLWSAGKNEAVADLFRRAHAQDPQPDYLFGRARAEIRQGNCTTGSALLDQFLATSPPTAQVDAAQTERDKCQPRTTEPKPVPVTTPTVEPAPPVAATVAPALSPSPPPEPSRRDTGVPPWRRDAVGWTLVSLGAAGLATGVALFVVGRNRALQPDSTRNETEYGYETRRGQRMAWAGLGIGSGGIVLALGGAIRLGMRRH